MCDPLLKDTVDLRLNSKPAIGLAMSLIGALSGTIFVLFLFVSTYQMQVGAEVIRGAPIEALLVSFVIPAMADLALIGGILWTISGYGFVTQSEWAFPTAVAASVVSILAGFFPILPWVSSSLGFPPTSVIFALNLLFFVLLQTHVRSTEKLPLLLSLLAGVAYILAFINSVAGIHYLIATNSPIFIVLQPVNFIASLGWAATTISLTLAKSRSTPLAIGSAMASLLGGIPIALVTQLELARPSLFWPSPLVAAAAVTFICLARVGTSKSPAGPV
jgi:hypothetical protein